MRFTPMDARVSTMMSAIFAVAIALLLRSSHAGRRAGSSLHAAQFSKSHQARDRFPEISKKEQTIHARVKKDDAWGFVSIFVSALPSAGAPLKETAGPSAPPPGTLRSG